MASACASSATVVLEVAPDANHGFALGFDYVVARDAQLAEELSSMTSRDWHESRLDLEASFGRRLEAYRCELPPGTRTPPWEVEPVSSRRRRKRYSSRRRPVHGVFLFVDYATAQDNRRRLDGVLESYQTVRVLLEPGEIRAKGLDLETEGVKGFPCVSPRQEEVRR